MVEKKEFMNIKKLKKGDKVAVLLGKDRGKQGTIEKVLTDKGKIVVNGVNLYKRHVRKFKNIEGGIIEIVKPIDVSNVLLVCPNCQKKTRVGMTVVNGKKQRICKKCKKVI